MRPVVASSAVTDEVRVSDLEEFHVAAVVDTHFGHHGAVDIGNFGRVSRETSRPQPNEFEERLRRIEHLDLADEHRL